MTTYEYRSRVPCPFFDDNRHCVIESPVNEQQIWCEDCGQCAIWTPMHKFYGSVNFNSIMHEHFNVSVGRNISDIKQFRDALKENQDFMSDKLGFDQHYGEADPTDTDTLGVTDEGLDATHDRLVRGGRRESKGRFVWPASNFKKEP